MRKSMGAKAQRELKFCLDLGYIILPYFKKPLLTSAKIYITSDFQKKQTNL